MKTPYQIFDWLVRNSEYYHVEQTRTDLERLIAEDKEDGVTLLCAVNRIAPFHADYDKFVEFVGEPYSFKRHLLPLVLGRFITCHSLGAKDFYGSDIYKPIFDHAWGLVKDYDTDKQYVRYWLGQKCIS